MRRTLSSLATFLLVLAPLGAFGDSVVPSERVQSHLRVRASVGGPVIASLRPGDRASHLGTVDGWHQIELADGRVGVVAAAWSRVERDVTPPSSAHLQVVERPFGARVKAFFRRASEWFGADPHVEVVLRDPVHDGAVHEHDDPVLPVAGLATPEGASGTYDLVLALDTSTSTRAFSEFDVDEDGRLDRRMHGPDSIYRAQVRAAREFVAALGRLPANPDGERVRVGVVGFAGNENVSRSAFEATPAGLLALARADAVVHVPVTSDYARVDRELARLADHEPDGGTDFAAGIGSAMAALGVLSEGPASEGPRASAQRAILFLTDGNPSLPEESETGEAAALYASRMARDAGVRIHTFALGYDSVRRGPNPVVSRMAKRTHGSFTQLVEPGEIVTLLSSTSFSFVSSVRLVNATRGGEAAEVATAIDGSFYGELPLVEGPNEIEVEAVLNDGRHARRKLVVTWVDTKPIKALQARLEKLREDNEMLVEKLRHDLVSEMQSVRSSRRQEKRDVRITSAR